MIPGAPSWWTHALDLGDVGDDVKTVQRLVGAWESGVFDEGTAARVRGWQRVHGLFADGHVDLKSAQALEASR